MRDDVKIVVSKHGMGKTHRLILLALSKMTEGKDVLFITRSKDEIPVLFNEILKIARKCSLSFETKYKEDKLYLLDNESHIKFITHGYFIDNRNWVGVNKGLYFTIADNVLNTNFDAISINGTLI